VRGQALARHRQPARSRRHQRSRPPEASGSRKRASRGARSSPRAGPRGRAPRSSSCLGKVSTPQSRHLRPARFQRPGGTGPALPGLSPSAGVIQVSRARFHISRRADQRKRVAKWR
jgi:hypothetical protein